MCSSRLRERMPFLSPGKPEGRTDEEKNLTLTRECRATSAQMRIGSTPGSRGRGTGRSTAILSILLICCAGRVQDQPANQSECLNNSLTEPISRIDAVIIALSHPGVPEAIEHVSFQISVGTLRISADPREDYPGELYVVYIDRFNSSTDEQLETLAVDVTMDGQVYKIRTFSPPTREGVNEMS